MKKFLSLLLCIVLVLSLAACGGPAPAPTPTPSPSPTPTPAPTPDPLELALEEFDAAIEDFHSAGALDISINVDIDRRVFDFSYSETVKEDFNAQGLQGDTPIIRRVQNIDLCGQGYTNEYVYSGGYVFLNHNYRCAMSVEEYLSSLYAMQLFDPDNFACVELDGTALVFSEAQGPEFWLGDGIELNSAEARAELNSEGKIQALDYSVSYEKGIAEVDVSISLEVESYAAGADLRAFIPVASDILEIEDLRAVELRDRAYILTISSPAQTSFGTTVYSIRAGNAVLTEQITKNVFGTGRDMLMKEEIEQLIVENDQTYRYNAVGKYENGFYSFAVDGEVASEPVPYDELELNDLAAEFLSFNDGLTEMTMRELNGYYVIEYSLDEDYAKYTQAYVCDFLYGNPTLLDSVASAYTTDKCSGWLSVNADTLLPVGSGFEYKGRHTINGLDYPISLANYSTCDLASISAYEAVTGEKPVEVEPENKATPLFYKVSGDEGQEMWLLGTIHIGDERTAYLPDSIYTALESSDALAVELNLQEMEDGDVDSDIIEAFLSAVIYADGSPVATHLSSELYDAAMEMLRVSGCYYGSSLEYMKPSYLSELLDSAYASQGCRLTSDRGVDMRLISLANEKGIEIKEVETLQIQLDALYSGSDELQEFMLRSSVEADRRESAAKSVELYELWCSGDEEALYEYINAESDDISEEELALYEEYYKALSDDRNVGMHATAVEYLESGETVFYAVGLAHLLAEGGLVQSLREAGYTVELVR